MGWTILPMPLRWWSWFSGIHSSVLSLNVAFMKKAMGRRQCGTTYTGGGQFIRAKSPVEQVCLQQSYSQCMNQVSLTWDENALLTSNVYKPHQNWALNTSETKQHCLAYGCIEENAFSRLAPLMIFCMTSCFQLLTGITLSVQAEHCLPLVPLFIYGED